MLREKLAERYDFAELIPPYALWEISHAFVLVPKDASEDERAILVSCANTDLVKIAQQRERENRRRWWHTHNPDSSAYQDFIHAAAEYFEQFPARHERRREHHPILLEDTTVISCAGMFFEDYPIFWGAKKVNQPFLDHSLTLVENLSVSA